MIHCDKLGFATVVGRKAYLCSWPIGQLHVRVNLKGYVMAARTSIAKREVILSHIQGHTTGEFVGQFNTAWVPCSVCTVTWPNVNRAKCCPRSCLW